MSTQTDLFFSYRRNDLDRAKPLLKALERAGISVWRDQTDIGDHDSITKEIEDGLAHSRALLAFYSTSYPESNPCQEELTRAWLAADTMEPHAYKRVWLVNPERDFQHIPELFRDQLIPFAKTRDTAKVAQQIKERMKRLSEETLGRGERAMPRYHGMAPDQHRYFVGRVKQRWQMHAQLTADRHSVITGTYGQSSTEVRGLGGNGKSLLAREYAIRFGPAYPGGVFWVRAYGYDDTGRTIDNAQRESARLEQIGTFATEMRLATEALKPEQVEALFWDELERRQQRCLWIVDDLASGLSDTELARWRPKAPRVAALYTTRSREYGQFEAPIDLGVLEPDEARKLLYAHRPAQTDKERQAAERIINALGRHPLAVAVAGSYLSRGHDTYSDYAEALENPSKEAIESGAELQESLPTGHARSIAATLLTSIEKLGKEGLELLRVASLLPSIPIPLGLVEAVFAKQRGDAKKRTLRAVEHASALSLCDQPELTASAQRQVHDPDEDALRASRVVHTLVSRVVRKRSLPKTKEQALRDAVVVGLAERIEGIAHIGEYSRIALDVSLARQLLADKEETEERVALAFAVAKCDWERSDYASARRLAEWGVEVHRRVLGEEHPDTLASMNNLAETNRAQGDLAGARALHEQELEICRKVLGDEHPNTLTSMNNLALTMRAQGDRVGARMLQERVVEIHRRVLGEEHPNALVSMGNLASTIQAQGDLVGARTLQEQVLEAHCRLLGEEHPDTLTSMGNLASTMWAQGDLAGARALLERVLEVRRRVLGEEHPNALASMGNLASIMQAQGDLVGARTLQEQVMEAHCRLLGEEHPDTLTSMGNLASTLWAQGDLVGAQVLQERVLKVRRRVLGEEHPDTLASMHNLACMLHKGGELEEAETLEAQAAEGFRKFLGAEHRNTKTAEWWLTQIRQDRAKGASAGE